MALKPLPISSGRELPPEGSDPEPALEPEAPAAQAPVADVPAALEARPAVW